jgi:outer membrane protein
MKRLVGLLAFAVLFSSVLNADFTRVGIGVGAWQQKSSGDAKYSETGYDEGKYKSDEDTKTQTYIWLDIKHPIPIIPNIRAEYVKIEDEGKVTGRFKDYDAGSGWVDAKFKLTQYDIIPYYNILDDTFHMTLDVGVDIKIFDMKYETGIVTCNHTGINTTYDDSSSGIIPLGYARLRFSMPFNLGLEGNGKYIAYDGSSLIDASLKVDWSMEFVPVLHPTFEFGYRYQHFYLDDKDNEEGKIDLSFAGFFAGIAIKY